MEEESSSEDESESRPPSRQLNSKVSKTVSGHGAKNGSNQPLPLPPTLDKVVIKKGYDPKQGYCFNINITLCLTPLVFKQYYTRPWSF